MGGDDVTATDLEYNSQLEDPAAVELAHHSVSDVAARYASDHLERAVEMMEELPYEDPSLGTSNLLQSAKTSVKNAMYRFDGEEPLNAEDKDTLKQVHDLLTAESSQYPAIGTRRHYNLDVQRQNL